MNINGYGDFPFEIGEVVTEKDDSGTTAKITSAGPEYVWYDILTVGDDLALSNIGKNLCTQTALFEEEWQKQ